MVVGLRRRSPLLGVIVPLALLAGQVSTVVHSMVVEHERCLEHGELVHRTLARGVDDLEATAGLARKDGRRAGLDPAPATDGHGHEHCLSFVNRRDVLRTAQPPAATAFAPPSIATSSPMAPATLACDEIFLLAPKTSPPLPTVTG